MSTSLDQPNRSGGSHYQPSTPVMIVLLLVFVVAAFVVERATHSPTTPSATPTTNHPTHGTKHTGGSTSSTVATVQKRAPKSRVSVQVANGTHTAGLARVFTVNLETQGWDTLSPINGPHLAATVVYYAPGYQWAAAEIASAVKVPLSAARPLGSARPVPGATGDDIILILGPNARP